MSQPVSRPDPRSATVDRFSFGDFTERWLLPSFALAALAIGLALLAAPIAAIGVYIPYALFVAGLVVLGASVSMTTRPPDSASAVSSAAPEPQRWSLNDTRHEIPKPVPDAQIGPKALGVGSEWRVPSSPVIPNDETWLSWLPPEHHWPAPGESPAGRGIVRSPGKAGSLVAFPVRSYYAGYSTSSPHLDRGVGSAAALENAHRPAMAAPSASPPSRGGYAQNTASRASENIPPFSVDELDRLFPPAVSGRTIFLSEAPQRVGRPTRQLRAPVATEASSEAGESPNTPEQRFLIEMETESDLVRGASMPTSERVPEATLTEPHHRMRSATVLDEATNPLPPHLRGVAVRPAHTGAHASDPLPRKARLSRSVCASCSKVVLDLRMSGPCPKCLRPICNECLREAFATQGHGWCVDCSTSSSELSESAS